MASQAEFKLHERVSWASFLQQNGNLPNLNDAVAAIILPFTIVRIIAVIAIINYHQTIKAVQSEAFIICALSSSIALDSRWILMSRRRENVSVRWAGLHEALMVYVISMCTAVF